MATTMTKTKEQAIQLAVSTGNITGVYNEFYNQVKFFINGKVKDEMTAEDLTADTFMKVQRFISQYDSKNAFTTWLYSIANNRVIDYWRTKNAKFGKNINVDGYVDEDGNELFQFEASNDVQETIESNESMNTINSAISRLKPKYQRIAELFFIKEMEYNEIAELCEVPLGTVKGMVFRCREMLQSELESLKNEYAI
jgi:RNA polymerase sigma-70 factor (ECF subfamily)